MTVEEPFSNLTQIDFYINVNEDRDVKVLQLSDTQIIDAAQKRTEDRLGERGMRIWATDTLYENLFKYLDDAILRTKPDFIFIAGDVIYGEFDDAGTSHINFINQMDSYKIPWGLVFGNHDNETKMGVDWQVSQYENSKYGIFKRGSVTGNSNYTVGIIQKEKLKRVIYLLDSNGTENLPDINIGKVKPQIGFEPDQINWFQYVASSVKEAFDYEVKGIATWHIPTTSFQMALDEKYPFDPFNPTKEGGRYDYSKFTFGNKLLPGRDGDFGTSQDIMHGAHYIFGLDMALENANIDGVFVGHVHVNSISILHEGIRWTYGLKTGTYDSHSTNSLGGTLITFDNDNILDVKHIYYEE